MDFVSKSGNDIIKGVENGEIKLSNNIQKGNYGEMKMDAYFEGYERISLDRVTDLNAPTHQGIDGVYYNPDGYPPYVIGEIRVTLYDVYGLDSNDIETNKIKNVCPTGWIAGFKAWYILQHNSSYTNYKPYITYMSYDETKTY